MGRHHVDARMKRENRIGIDIGRVIINGDGQDTNFLGVSLEEAMKAPAMPWAFDSIERIVRRFDGRAWLVSKCGESVARKSIQWLAHHGFWKHVGMDPDRIRFCRKRPEKAIICRELEITHFVDDRQDVLAAMDGVVEHRFLFQNDWPATEAAIYRSLA